MDPDALEDLIEMYSKHAEQTCRAHGVVARHIWLGMFGDFAYAVAELAQSTPTADRELSRDYQ